jgi:hypothetical protein
MYGQKISAFLILHSNTLMPLTILNGEKPLGATTLKTARQLGRNERDGLHHACPGHCGPNPGL